MTRSAGYKIHFRKQPRSQKTFIPCRCDIFRLFEIMLGPWQFVHGSRVFIQSNKYGLWINNLKTIMLTIESISVISLSSQRPRCFNNVILHLNQINKIKNAVVTRNILVSLRPSFSDEGTFSVRALEKPEKQFIDVHENSGFNHKEKTIRGRVLVPGWVLPRVLDRGVQRRFVNPNPI